MKVFEALLAEPKQSDVVWEYGYERGLLVHEVRDAIEALAWAINHVLWQERANWTHDGQGPSEECETVLIGLKDAREAIYARDLIPEMAAEAVLALMGAMPRLSPDMQEMAIDRAGRMTAAAARGAAKLAARTA